MDDRRRASAIRRRWQIGEALDLALDRGPRDDYRRPDVRSLRRLAALIEEDRGYFGHRHRLQSYLHAGRNVMCCTRKISDESRLGKEGVRPCRLRCEPVHL